MLGQLCDLAHRAIEVGSLEERPAPIEFMKWARSIGVEFHPDWWDAVVRRRGTRQGRGRGASTCCARPGTEDEGAGIASQDGRRDGDGLLRLGPGRAPKRRYGGNRERS